MFWKRNGTNKPKASANQGPDAGQDQRICKSIIDAGQNILEWDWDPRFSAHLASVASGDMEAALEIMSRFFCKRWDHKNLKSAFSSIKVVAESLGGIRPDQYLFTPENNDSALLYGIWWPWSDGSTVSVRISYYTDELSPELKDQFDQQFKTWM